MAHKEPRFPQLKPRQPGRAARGSRDQAPVMQPHLGPCRCHGNGNMEEMQALPTGAPRALGTQCSLAELRWLRGPSRLP